jgi:LL-diaminopimelate aminotransferase
MALRNPVFHQNPPPYLFADIARKVSAYKEKHPDIKLLNLGIGDTVYPLEQKSLALLMAIRAMAPASG